ncbi:hypothetical protein MAR_022313 [Mya arenaria]|uniref:Uncharacterized protein n=1 Tax=Mya arenaria TaxID=6604 RepID=A0ABY7DSK8_MYAAR|nr:hypothetical protein MAR_022313 [Mya arenaria]
MTIVWNQPQLSKRISSEDIRIINAIKTCCKFLLRSDDPKLVLDLKRNNGRVKDPQSDAFWKERIWMKKKSGFEKNATKVSCTVCVLDFIEFYASQPLQGICRNIQCETSSAAMITHAVEWRDSCTMQCLDNKAIVPVGELDKPTASCARKHHGSLVSGDGSLLTLDHDYNLCGIVPSVCLLFDIPTNSR